MKPPAAKPASDVHSPEVRSYNMSRIRGRDTRPELVIRRGLHARGYRYRLHVKDMPGRPDIVFPKHHAALFVHGCFWHGHNCPLFRMPVTRPEFWESKISANRSRDARNCSALANDGWRVLTVWECSMRGADRWPEDEIINFCQAFLNGNAMTLEIGHRLLSTDHTDDQLEV
ncbi:very short patch repair endonuclease [Sinorhizobium fredii]|uniref:very short patch repair endonuclease n=1 Tax=Rhizobium fredii TaxID=380 RepID=UPI0009B670C0|nr:very short patch repair endonuclease [Sinorhizobium fredii]